MTAVAMTTAQAEDAALQLEHDLSEIVLHVSGMHEREAFTLSKAIVRGLRQRYGGVRLYIPTPDKAERDAAVLRDFNGRNMAEVMQKHGIKRSTFYNIISKTGNRHGIGKCAPSAPK